MRFTIAYLLGCLYPLMLQGAQSASTEFHEETVAELPAGARFEAVAFASTHLAWAEKNNHQSRVFLDGKQQGGVYDQIQYLRFSPAEQHLAFVAKTGSSFVLIYDNQEHSEKYSSITYFNWQPHGSSLAYGACHEKKCRLVVDGAATGPEYEDISYPKYSHDGAHIAYLGKRAKKWFAVLDGKEIGSAMDDFFDLWGFSQDGGRFYVAARLKHQWTFVVDGSAGPGFNTVSPIAFSRGGKHYAFAGANEHRGMGTDRARGTLVLDGKEQGTFEGRGYSGWLSPEEPAPGVSGFSADFHGLSEPQFNPEGKLVYAARRSRGDVAVFVGEQAGAGFDDIVSPIVFSQDAKHLAYIALQGEDFVEVRDGQQGAKFPGKRKESLVSWIQILDDDSWQFAYEIVRGGNLFKYGRTARARRCIVVGGRAGPEYDALGISLVVLSKDRKRYGYVVQGVEGNHGRAVLDGRESRLYDEAFAGSLTFGPESGTVSFLAQDGQKLLRVMHHLDNEDHTRLPSHIRVSKAEKQHLLDDQFTLVTTKETMPPSLKTAFTAVTQEEEFALANPGQKYQATDFIAEPGLPWRRLVFAGTSGNKWFIHYELGGRGHSYRVVVFAAETQGPMRFLWGCWGFERAKDLADLRQMVADGRCRDEFSDSW